MAAANKNIQVLGGDRWKAALDVIRRNRLGLQVGVMPEAQNSETGEKVAPYAFFNEYGLGGIPPRPFMRKSIEKNSKEWAMLFGDRMRGRTTDKGAVREVLDTIGKDMKLAIVDEIKNGKWTPNSPATLARKNKRGDAGRNIPLFDTGSLADRSITWKVVDAGGAE